MAEEIVARLESEPSEDEWRAIRTFRLRADELANSSLVTEGYSLTANVSWKAGERPQFTVIALPAEEPFRSLLLTFRHFVAQTEPSNFLRVANIVARHAPEARGFMDHLRERWHQALFGGLMTLSFSEKPLASPDKPLTASHIFDLWLNAHYFHNDEAKMAELERLSNALSPDFVKFLLANAVTECSKAVLQLSYALSNLTNAKAAIQGRV